MKPSKICPIMSHPQQGDSAVFDNEEHMKKYGWQVFNGEPWTNIFMCQRDGCEAWSTEFKDTFGHTIPQQAGSCSKPIEEIGDDCKDIDCEKCPSFTKEVPGYCKLIK